MSCFVGHPVAAATILTFPISIFFLLFVHHPACSANFGKEKNLILKI